MQETRQVETRKLMIRARGIRPLMPWLAFQTAPLGIDAWLDPMEIGVTWTYLVQFLGELGPERVWIPCGEDSWVGWSPKRLTIRAARDSWLWLLAEDVWDPAAWSHGQELEWWAEGRPQHAVRLPWGTSEQRSWSTGWEEWTVRGEANHINALWLALAPRLGARPLRVKWRQEVAPASETLLGLKARYIACDLVSDGGRDSEWLNRIGESPEPLYVRTQAIWTIPEWTEHWSTIMTLRRVQRGTRLEATYSPRQPMRRESWKSLQRERRRIPILQMRPLVLGGGSKDLWEQLTQESEGCQRQDRLIKFLNSTHWPSLGASCSRVRLAPGWSIKRWASQVGLWVIEYQDLLEVSIEWPSSAHPGNIAISSNGATPVSMNEWVRASHFHRLNRDPRYWAHWISSVFLPVLQKFMELD